jgi:hypothetical protein
MAISSVRGKHGNLFSKAIRLLGEAFCKTVKKPDEKATVALHTAMTK